MGATEWEMHMSDDGRPYYYNSRTQESTWEPPPSMMMSMMAGITKQKKNVERKNSKRKILFLKCSWFRKPHVKIDLMYASLYVATYTRTQTDTDTLYSV